MKIQALGTGSIFSTSLSSSYLIDEHLLFDVPNGIVKQMKKLNITFSKIEKVYISHFHGDHFFDLPFLLMALESLTSPFKKLTIIGPTGIEQITNDICRLAFPDISEQLIKNTIKNYIEINPLHAIHSNDYTLQMFKMKHSELNVYGLSIIKDNLTISFTADTTVCPAVWQLASNSDVLYAEMSSEKNNDYHMGPEAITLIKKTYPKLKLIVTHLSDHVRQLVPCGIEIAKDGNTWFF